LILIAALLLIQYLLCGIPDSQKAAERWSNGGERFAQISVFIEKGEGLTESDIRTIRSRVDSALTQASMSPASPDVRAWIDAYHAESRQTFSSERASAAADVLGVGGDFFHFHSFELHDGYYFSDSDTLYDRIVIDEIGAWQLFGSFDVTGMTVKIGQRPFVIAGVIKAETDFASQAAIGENAAPRVYMSYTALAELDETIEICCYEAVVPDPVSGFGKKLITDSISIGEDQRIVTENSQRYHVLPLLRLCGSFGQRSMMKTAVRLPYWENAARMIEEYAALVQLLWMLLCLIPLVGLIVLIVYLWKNRTFHIRDIPDIYDQIRTERYHRRQEKKLEKAKINTEVNQDEKVEK